MTRYLPTAAGSFGCFEALGMVPDSLQKLSPITLPARHAALSRTLPDRHRTGDAVTGSQDRPCLESERCWRYPKAVFAGRVADLFGGIVYVERRSLRHSCFSMLPI
jgi:hypothetical protein